VGRGEALRAPVVGVVLKPFVGLAWAGLFVAVVVAWGRSDVALVDTPALIEGWLSGFGLGRAGAIYVVLYAVRPLVLFPATLLTVASGLVFGPVLGIVFTIAGENLSANLAFALARWLGRDWVGAHEHGAILVWEGRIRENGLVGVLLMRLVYLPFDAVSYGCGLTSMRQRDFAIGTFIGILPGLVSFVLLGGAASAGVEDRLVVLGAAVVFFLLGLALARRVREHAPTGPDA
jgi:uncharacterized membrane protein YdjX (TVP38/TMEM64 family)